MSVACTLCGQPAALCLLTQDLNRRLSQEVFSYYCCSTCGLIFLFPVPNDLDAYYPSGYYSIPASLNQLASQAEGEYYKLGIIRKFVSAGRLLEIGPAYGSFAYLAKQAGFEVEAIEMDGACCRFLREVVGVRATQSQDPCTALSGMGTYDVITLWQVIEHVPDPWPLLNSIVEHLAPGGLIAIAAPNPDALQFRVFGRWWTHVDAPRHVQLIPIALLARRMRELGLTARVMTTKDQGALGWNIFGWQRSLMNRFAFASTDLPLRIVGRLLSLLFSPWERTDLLGSTYTLVFQK